MLFRSALYEMEKHILHSVLSMGRNLLIEYVEICNKEIEEVQEVWLNGRKLQRMPDSHNKTYQSIFGKLEIPRVVYAKRAGQKIEYVPLDARLKLPKEQYSYLLLNWSQGMAVDMPYAQVSKTLENILGIKVSISALERQNKGLGTSVENFWQHSPQPVEAEDKEIIVLTADGKGVPIRPDGCKRMAVVGASYHIKPYHRTPEEVCDALFAKKAKKYKKRPRPIAKQVRASLRRDDNTMQASYDEVFTWLDEQNKQRNPNGNQTVVFLSDGQETLWKNAKEYIDADVVEILDILHANSYIHKAAKALHKKQKQQQIFSQVLIAYLLEGKIQTVLKLLKGWELAPKTTKKQRKALETAYNYIENNAHRMRYDEYLAKGYPIASGVIEGACRYVVRDRMERTGMRWTMRAAKDMLALRCIFLNDEWDNFLETHVQQQNLALYPYAANDEAFSITKAA